jgi:hypothetical protein
LTLGIAKKKRQTCRFLTGERTDVVRDATLRGRDNCGSKLRYSIPLSRIASAAKKKRCGNNQDVKNRTGFQQDSGSMPGCEVVSTISPMARESHTQLFYIEPMNV